MRIIANSFIRGSGNEKPTLHPILIVDSWRVSLNYDGISIFERRDGKCMMEQPRV